MNALQKSTRKRCVCFLCQRSCLDQFQGDARAHGARCEFSGCDEYGIASDPCSIKSKEAPCLPAPPRNKPVGGRLTSHWLLFLNLHRLVPIFFGGYARTPCGNLARRTRKKAYFKRMTQEVSPLRGRQALADLLPLAIFRADISSTPTWSKLG